MTTGTKRTEISKLVDAVQAVLKTHLWDKNCDCTTCKSMRALEAASILESERRPAPEFRVVGSSNTKLLVIEPYRSKDGVTAEVYYSKLGGTGAVVIQADTGSGEEAEVVLSLQEVYDLALWLQCALGNKPHGNETGAALQITGGAGCGGMSYCVPEIQWHYVDCQLMRGGADLRCTCGTEGKQPSEEAEVQHHSRDCDCHDCHYAKKHPQVKPHHARCGCFECAPKSAASPGAPPGCGYPECGCPDITQCKAQNGGGSQT